MSVRMFFFLSRNSSGFCPEPYFASRLVRSHDYFPNYFTLCQSRALSLCHTLSLWGNEMQRTNEAKKEECIVADSWTNTMGNIRNKKVVIISGNQWVIFIKTKKLMHCSNTNNKTPYYLITWKHFSEDIFPFTLWSLNPEIL